MFMSAISPIIVTPYRLGDIIFQGPKSNCFRGELVLRVTWPLIGYYFPVTYDLWPINTTYIVSTEEFHIVSAAVRQLDNNRYKLNTV